MKPIRVPSLYSIFIPLQQGLVRFSIRNKNIPSFVCQFEYFYYICGHNNCQIPIRPMAKQIDILCSEITLYNAWNIVKEKGAAGGIDGVTIMEFEKDKRKQISKLVDELANKTWKPYPYLEIEIAKDKSPEEKRKLGMTAIRDKIVQLAIKTIIEPRYDRIFVGNSYGYRPGKGATKAIRRVLQECKNKKYKYVLRLDIDNFFDSIDHFLLRRKLVATGTEEEIVRLIMLCMQMGKVKQKNREWIDTMLGTPQGAVLSPLMANLYLHSFDQFAISRRMLCPH